MRGLTPTQGLSQSVPFYYTNTPSTPSGLEKISGLTMNGTINIAVTTQTFASWTTGSLAVTPNSVLSPDGTLDAAAGTSSGDAFSQNPVFSPSAIGLPYTFSVWLKVPSSTLSLNIYLYGTGSFGAAVANPFTLTTDWQRIYVSRVATGTSASGTAQIGGANSFSSGKVVHMWGAQIEQNSYPTNYTSN